MVCSDVIVENCFCRDLHSNGLTGVTPSKIWNLANLVELRLDRNKLSGQILGTSTHGMYAIFFPFCALASE